MVDVTQGKRGKPPGFGAKTAMAVAAIAIICLLAWLFFGPLLLVG